MILYKYLPPERIDVLRNQRIRFTQPADFNDPFEFRPVIKEITSGDSVKDYIEKNFDQLVETELAKYGTIIPAGAKSILPEFIAAQKANLPALFQTLSPALIDSIRPRISELLNQHVGVLCLSEINDSLLMWGHYAANHHGFVIGFDSENAFFNARRSQSDEFGFLRKVKYTSGRPQVTLANSDSIVWFEQKHEDWGYEKEWRVLRVARDASLIIDRQPFPIHLFEFPKSAVREIIVGMNSDATFRQEVRTLVANFPEASYFIANEHPEDYRVTIDQNN